MLWQRHKSLYSSANKKSDNVLVKDNKNLLPAVQNSNTIDPKSLPRFIVRRAKSKVNKLPPQSYYFLHKGNNHHLVKAVLDQMGFLEGSNKEQCDFIWYQGKEAPKKDFIKREINPKATNYLQHHAEVTNKQKLYENISRYEPSCVGDFVPRTFIVDFKDTLAKVEANLVQFLVQYFRKSGLAKAPKKNSSLFITNFYGEICIPLAKVFKILNQQRRQQKTVDQKHKNQLWIVKPSSLNRGQGIEVISSLKQLQKIMNEDTHQISIRMYQTEENTSPSCYVIQEYIMNPLLYQGYKFDIRVWILLRNSKVNGLQVYMYSKAYARLAGHKYIDSCEPIPESDDQDTAKKQNDSPRRKDKALKVADKFVHLTNNAVQKHCKQYGQLHEGNQLLLSDLVARLGRPQLTHSYLYDNFKRMTKTMVESVREKLSGKASYGSFQLMGLDFMIDTQLKAWLIEANCNPCLEESSPILREVLPKMLKQMFEVVKIHRIIGNKELQNETPLHQRCWERLI